jgi:3-oxoacyl-[acyl-carrier protein] reductase
MSPRKAPWTARAGEGAWAEKYRVNAINPGVVETEGTHAGGEFERQAVQQAPLGRIGQPADIAAVAVFLASDDARWVTGETLFASGGL